MTKAFETVGARRTLLRLTAIGGLSASLLAGLCAAQAPLGSPAVVQQAVAQPPAAAPPAPIATPPAVTAPARRSSAQADAGEPRADASAPGRAPVKPGGRKVADPTTARAADRLDLGAATVTGDREQPKVMYIVPWKRADVGDNSGKPMNSLLDEALAPVDRDEFKREIAYFNAVNTSSQPQGEK